MKRDVMEAQPGEVLMFEGKRHRVTRVTFTGFVPPYFDVACVDHECEARFTKRSHMQFRWPETEPQARDDQSSVVILLKGREPRGVFASPPAADSEG